jgi:glycosyltransferase involved in cell wall biosynthesis/GT2 family glycosyltransferase
VSTLVKTLPEIEVAADGASPRICIATWEIEGPSRNAGIGTAYTSLSDALRRANYDVTILFLLGCHPTDGNISEWIDYYRREKGVELVPLPMAHHPRIHAAWASSVSYHTYVWLKEHQHDFNIIHFPECQGLGFYSLLAKRQGLAFGNTTFIVGTHGPTFWVKEGSLDYIRNLGELEIDYMERASVAAADVVISPSQYLLSWMRKNEWELPERTYVAPYLRPYGDLFKNPASPRKNEVREIVFFGRLEARKGLKVFCDAIDELCAGSCTPKFEVTFLGKETAMYGRSSIGYISDRSKKWSNPWRIVANKYQAGAIEYLRGDGRLAVISSLADNFPNTVLECVGAGVPFLASNVGGIPEIIAPADREKICFEPRPDILAARIREALDHGAFPANPSVAFTDNERRWVAWHSALASQPAVASHTQEEWSSDEESFPLVSVCLPHSVHGKGVDATVASLQEQDYSNFEIILVECGSDPAGKPGSPGKEETPTSHPIHRLRRQSGEIGAGRNAAARQAQGEYLLFVDDHSILLPGSLSTLIQIAQRVNADIVTSAISFFIGSPNSPAEHRLEHSRRPFLGADIATGAFVNCFGSPNALVKRKAFEILGGFSDDAVTTLDDWEFFSKAALKGLRIETTPEVLLWHREDQDQESLVHSLMNAARSVRPYTEPGSEPTDGVRQALFKVMKFGQGLKFEGDVLVGSPLSRGEQGPAVTG